MTQYRPIDGEIVSTLWYPLLKDIREVDGVRFNVNEGKRTFARQQELYNLYRAGRGALAAVPSHNAPHIRTGRSDHAIDFDNAAGVIAAAAKRGVRLIRTVPGEEWHVEIADPDQLRAYNRRRRAKIRRLLAAVKKAKRRWKAARAAYRRRTGR